MDSTNNQWSRMPTWAIYAAIVAVPTTAYLGARLKEEYQGWLALGPGGLPYNFRGFVTNLLLTTVLAKRDTTSVSVYERPEKHAVGWKQASAEEKLRARESFLDGPLPTRAGPRAEAKHYCAPQREKNADEYIDPVVKETYLQAADALGDEHADAIEWKTSVFETRGKAIFLRSDYALPTLIAKCQREVAHIHESDLSAHVLLSLKDASEAVEKGWAERHRMSGSVIPLGYTLLYSPRSGEEVEAFVHILEAGIRYAKSRGEFRPSED